jgi:hypothetical protein
MPALTRRSSTLVSVALAIACTLVLAAPSSAESVRGKDTSDVWEMAPRYNITSASVSNTPSALTFRMNLKRATRRVDYYMDAVWPFDPGGFVLRAKVTFTQRGPKISVAKYFSGYDSLERVSCKGASSRLVRGIGGSLTVSIPWSCVISQPTPWAAPSLATAPRGQSLRESEKMDWIEFTNSTLAVG